MLSMRTRNKLNIQNILDNLILYRYNIICDNDISAIVTQQNNISYHGRIVCKAALTLHTVRLLF